MTVADMNVTHLQISVYNPFKFKNSVFQLLQCNEQDLKILCKSVIIVRPLRLRACPYFKVYLPL